MQLLRKFLLPFSVLYGGVVLARNEMFDRKILKAHSFDLPLICVGNLSVGGTGKSPMVEYLINLLKEDYPLATLSRGYKRKTSGFYLLKGSEEAWEVGDEPLQFKRKYPEVQVAVDEVRSHGITELLQIDSPPEVIILDDAFQHRQVAAGLNILLTSYDNLYSRDFMLPTGNLREPTIGRRRAQIVIVTKCPPDLPPDERKRISQELDLHPDQSLFFTAIGYNEDIFSSNGSRALEWLKGRKFTLVTGIAKPAPLVDYLQSLDLDFSHLAFPDHHAFTEKEIEALRKKEMILTTEKDYMRLQGSLKEAQLYYLPISTKFLGEGEVFDALVRRYIIKK